MKNRISIILLFIIVTQSIFNSSVAYALANKIVYVSSSTGNDYNKGDTPDCPVQTIKKALSFRTDTIKLKRGDVFHESITYCRSSIIGYGDGSLPVLSGYKRIVQPSWVKVRDNIWKLCLTDDIFTGYRVEGSSFLNNIGCIHEYDRDLVHGKRIERIEHLKDDWDFWQCEGHGRDLPASSFDYIYMYLSSNPNQKKLELSLNVCGINMYEGHNLVNSIRLEGFNTAVNFNMAGDITNCRIDAIGGNLFLSDIYGFVCAGNGIQYWVGKYSLDNSIMKGNYITRCYDSGITIQGDGRISPKNITISENLIANCCQGWEDFLHNKDNYYDNCSFENNIVVFSGNSGFGYPESRFKCCHILQNNSFGPKGMVFKNNTFIGGNYYCSEPSQKAGYSSAVWIVNVCYIEKGRYITGRYHGTYDIVRVPKRTSNIAKNKREIDDALAEYRSITNDTTTRFIVVSDRKAKRLGKRAIKNYLKTHTY